MNIGNLPGYYWDEEKKKYFKIQANHVAPPHAKYTVSNVKRERRERKKRKFSERHHTHLLTETVPRANLLRHPLVTGSGLAREHGNKPSASYHAQRDAAFVQGLESNEVTINLSGFERQHYKIRDALYLPASSQVLLSVSHGSGAHSLWAYERHDRWRGRQHLHETRPLHAFHDPIISLCDTTYGGRPVVIACTAITSASSGNAFVAPLPDFHDDPLSNTGYVFTVGTVMDTLWDCKINPLTKHVAFASTKGAEVHSLAPEMISMSQLTPSGNTEAFACEWLDAHTLAVGMRQRKAGRAYHDVLLWDIRADGVAYRIVRKNRIIGLHAPDQSGKTLLVGGNTDIGLYDMRSAGSVNMNDDTAVDKLRSKPAMLTFNHLSALPHLDMATYNGECLSVLNSDDKLQTYSLRTGLQLRTFGLRPDHYEFMASPRWQEDERGAPYLQACAGKTVQEWV